MDEFSKIPADEKKPYFETAAANAGNMSEHIIEKDFWVCWTLKRLFSMPMLEGHLIFKGGTSLSKVFRVIERFSEDIDLSLSKELLGFGGKEDPEKTSSAKQRAKRIEDLAQACSEFVKTQLHAELKSAIKATLGTTKGWSLELDPNDRDEQTLLFAYPSTTKPQSSYVPQSVKIEVGARSDHWPAHQHSIQPHLAEHINDALKSPKVSVKTLDAARTFWEKATILHSYAHYPDSKTPAARQSRHYYDFYKLLQTKHKDEAVGDLQLLSRVTEHKSIYFRASWAKYAEAKKGTLKLTPSSRVEDLMKRDYEQMQEMFFEEPPTWSEIMTAIKLFENRFNV